MSIKTLACSGHPTWHAATCPETDEHGHPCIKPGEHETHNNGHGTAWRYVEAEA